MFNLVKQIKEMSKMPRVKSSPPTLELDEKMYCVSRALANNDLTLNCVQFINLINFYFEGKDEASEEKLGTNAIYTCFPCIACSSHFSFEHTFHLHLERRSILVRFFCIQCNTFKTFYNKCKLVYHVYSHKMFLFEPIYKAIKIEAISLERLSMSKERNIELGGRKSEATLAQLLASNRVQSNDNEQIKLFLKRILVNKFLLYRCGVCDALFFDPRELKAHYSKSMGAELNLHRPALNRRMGFKALKLKYSSAFDPNMFDFLTKNNDSEHDEKTDLFISEMNQYSFKKLQFSTRCAGLAAINLIDGDQQSSKRERVNTQPSALICPECGLSFDPSTQAENFRTHLIHECFFNTKYDYGQVKCPSKSCNLISESSAEFVSHWSKCHLIKQHLCDLCEKSGTRYAFRDEGNEHSSDISSKASNAVKQILKDEEGLGPEIAEPTLSPSTIAEINKHFFEKHRNMQVTLKLIYRCTCKSEDKEMGGEIETCVHTSWKACYKHILNLMSISISTTSCIVCKKQISSEQYPAHLKDEHQLEKVCICPFCGVLGEK